MRRLIANLIPMARYVAKTVEHKVYVFTAGRRVGAPLWRLIIHDWSKFTPAELPHYARQFYGAKDDPLGWSRAWLHHQNGNAHHWEYWVTRSGAGNAKAGDPVEMPDRFVREMVADWLGASRAYAGKWPQGFDTWDWYQANFSKIALHPTTRLKVVAILDAYFHGTRV